jgi:hypothetical protein
MRITWRDALATLFVALALVVYAAWAIGASIPGFGEVNAVAVAVLILGVAASISAVVPGFAELLHGSRLYLVTASALGLLAVGAGLWAFLAGEAMALAGLVLVTVAMWAMSTVRHAGIRQPQHLGHR